MASEWTVATLAEVSDEISYGYTESAADNKVGPHFLRITDIQNGVVDWKTVPYCPIADADLAKYTLEKGDIVVARTGNSTGENYIFDCDEEAVFASYLIRFRIAKKKADPHFVWYSMRSPSWWSFVNASKTGSAQAGANAKVLGTFELPLPPLAEQRAIANILGVLDDKIELNRRMNETLEGLARAIFQSWFVDFDGVRRNAELKSEGGRVKPPPFHPSPFTLQNSTPSSPTASRTPNSARFPRGGRRSLWRARLISKKVRVFGIGNTPKKECGSSISGASSMVIWIRREPTASALRSFTRRTSTSLYRRMTSLSQRPVRLAALRSFVKTIYP